MPIENRNLEAGTRLVATYKKQTYVCKVEKREDGKLEYVLDDGRRFASPSAAGSAVMVGSACNGWRFWTVEGEERPVTGEEDTGRRAKPKKAVQDSEPGSSVE